MVKSDSQIQSYSIIVKKFITSSTLSNLLSYHFTINLNLIISFCTKLCCMYAKSLVVDTNLCDYQTSIPSRLIPNYRDILGL